MHEVSLMRALMAKLESLAREQRAKRVKGVRVWLGALSHFSAEHFREHFEEASRGTTAHDAALEIEVSTDLADPRAQDVIVRSIDVEVAG
ncbi:MAG: hydrogenase maturation nickel metallochaperone HypA [Planctomycetes bacterium]|nr:hydrogenase maturation nickel metallochaperone HypA [Planctomycetota bacterium]